MADYRTEAQSAHPYNAVGGRDHLAWAKQIMYRDERKCSDLSAHQVKEAKMALGIDQPKKP
jgi:hypothetical protein